jgi:hypothetical protein
MWSRPVILALRRQRQEAHEFKTSLKYRIRSCLKKKRPSVMVTTCNPSYSGGRDQECQAQLQQKSRQVLISTKIGGHSVTCACHLSHTGSSIINRMAVQAGPRKNTRPYLKNSQN